MLLLVPTTAVLPVQQALLRHVPTSSSTFSLSLVVLFPPSLDTTQRAFSALLLVCGAALVRCSVELLLFGGNGEHLPHRAVHDGVPDAAFHATYAGHLLGLYLAHRVARVRQTLFENISRYETGVEYRTVGR